eukprot:scaffold129_cov254-Pinguiococcus_pyrenoidosus.AAC.5
MLDVPKVGHAAELGRRRGRAHSHLLPRLLFRFLLHNLDDLADGRRGLRQRCPGLLEAQTHYPADRDHVGRLRQLQLKGNTVATAEVAKVAGRPATSQVLGRGRVVVHVRMQRSQRRPPHQRSSVSRTGCAKRESGAEPRAGREHDALLAQLRRRAETQRSRMAPGWVAHPRGECWPGRARRERYQAAACSETRLRDPHRTERA